MSRAAGNYLAELIKLMKVVLGFHRRALRTLSVNLQILPPETTLPGAVVERGRCSTGESQENVIDPATRTGTSTHGPQGAEPDWGGDASPRDVPPRKRRRVTKNTRHGMQESEEESRGAQAIRLPTKALEGNGDQGMTTGKGRGPLEMHNQESLAPPIGRPKEAINVP